MHEYFKIMKKDNNIQGYNSIFTFIKKKIKKTKSTYDFSCIQKSKS